MIIAFMNIVLWVGLSFAILRPYGAPMEDILLPGILLGVIYAILDADRHSRSNQRGDEVNDV